MLKIKKEAYNSVLISADSNEELSDTMMRFQEYYENPFWKGKIFTIGQFKNWYSEKYGYDSYRFDWVGFNFPSNILDPFKKGLFDPLTENEKFIVDSFKHRSDKFYVIGSNSKDVLNHELCHALYYYNENYRNEINILFEKNKSKLNKAAKHLIKIGYRKDVVFDELQAYILDKNYFEDLEIEIPLSIKEQVFNLKKKYGKNKKN
jgi:hypothetical protein